MRKLTLMPLLLLLVISSASAVQQLMSLQGRVTTTAGGLVSSGNLTVLVYDAASGGNLIWNSSNDFNNVIQSGYFDVMLGSVRNLTIENNKIYYMDLEINQEDIDWNGVERRQFQSPVGTNFTGDTNFTFDTNTLFVDSTNNNVGIGTTGPGYPLTVNRDVGIGTSNTANNTNIFAVLDIGKRGSLFARRDTGTATSLGNNIYYDGLNRYRASDYAAVYEQDSGVHRFIASASSGTAGSQITTWTEQMYITAGGNVGIGTTGPQYLLTVANGTNGAAVNLSNVLYINSTTGNVGIGTTSPQQKLHIYSAGSIDTRIRIEADTNAAQEGGLEFYEGSTAKALIVYRADVDTIRVYNPTEMLTLENNANFGINNTNPSVALDVTGDIEYTGTITDVSDIRVKKNIVNITNALEKIQQIRGIYYEPNFFASNETDVNENSTGKKQLGVIAQEVEKVLPEVVSKVNENGYLGVDYTQFVPVLIEAVKELKAENDNLAKENSQLRLELSDIKSRLAALEGKG